MRPAPLLIGALAALLAWGLAGTDLLRRAELTLLDARFLFRDEWSGSTPVPVRDDLVVIGLDEKTYELYERPFDPDPTRRHSAFWPPLYAEALARVVDAGATVAALDLVPKYLDEPMLIRVAEGLAPRQGRILLTALLVVPADGSAAYVERPPDELEALVADPVEGRNLCLNNVPRDLDGIVRSQTLRPWATPDDSALPPLGVRLAQKHSALPVDVPLVDGERFLIHFAGGPKAVFPMVPLWQVLEADPAWLRSQFAGKAVVMGPWAVRDADFVETPYFAAAAQAGAGTLAQGTRGLVMPGVEVHLHIANTLLTGAFLRTATTWPLLLLVTMLAASLAGRLPTARGALAAAVTAAAWVAVAWWAFAAAWTWLEVVPVLAAIPTALLGVFAWRYWFEERAARDVRRLFGRYVSPEVMEEILHDPRKQELGATGKRVVTVLFSDINGFSTVAERHTPEEVLAMLNRYFEEMTAVIFRHKGTVKQFVGDEILAFFGAPREHPDAERAAVECALEMVGRLRQLREAGEEGFLSCKVGIHTGEVIVGNVGSSERSEYAAVGDDVNLGSRIMGMTKSVGAEILISGTTRERLGDMLGVQFIPHGEREVKGRREKVAIYEVRPAGVPAAEPAPTGVG